MERRWNANTEVRGKSSIAPEADGTGSLYICLSTRGRSDPEHLSRAKLERKPEVLWGECQEGKRRARALQCVEGCFIFLNARNMPYPPQYAGAYPA
ncbi:Hypothetical predicted protein [Pelobates cultripes]|uniref:Uncharacterized protein n=1 Tax=Pelobates cultripes TaxID=61616 RepID=A0AAD1QYU0_PELCU|nr:Hypothetical predicted protein [Pelobates cultripes]